MGYLGNTPTNTPLTGADIADDSIESADIKAGTIVNSDINASAAIAQSKLVDIVNADIDASAAIVTSKLSGAVTSIASHGLAASATTDTTSASNISSGTLSNARLSGVPTSSLTGAVTSIASHGLATSATTDTTDASNIGSGTLAVARGGTGATTHTANNVLVGNGTSAIASVAPSTSGNVLTSNGSAWTSAAAAGGGKIVQVVNVIESAVATSTTTNTLDDTIPQQTEGHEVMTLAITPTSSSNKLFIISEGFMTHSRSGCWVNVALFQDTTANALSANTSGRLEANDAGYIFSLTHYMTAGTTSSTTFKIRAGGQDSGTMTFNGSGGTRYMGGVIASSITIMEIAV